MLHTQHAQLSNTDLAAADNWLRAFGADGSAPRVLAESKILLEEMETALRWPGIAFSISLSCEAEVKAIPACAPESIVSTS